MSGNVELPNYTRHSGALSGTSVSTSLESSRMSLFSWIFPAAKKSVKDPDSSGLSRMEATRPVPKSSKDTTDPDNAKPANRKSERMARRELLYGVVRESMVNAGVLSSSYKFKVLSLDARGRQFLVMVDLARDHGGETARLAEIEAMIAQSAKARYDIIVTAVYWRTNEHVAVGDPSKRQRSVNSQPAPLEATPAVAPVRVATVPTPAAARGGRFEPINADEVAAFKRALAAGAATPVAAAATGATAKAFDGSSRHGPQSYTLLTGFEDTEMADTDQRAPALSGTQYGDLT
jgi:hypothetical protein